jgi:hypothetical protein
MLRHEFPVTSTQSVEAGMHGHGIAGALGSMVRRAALAIVMLCAPHQIRAAIITETIAGSIIDDPSAFYQANIGGPLISLNNQNFSLVYTIDGTKSQQGTQYDSSGIPLSTYIESLADSNPTTAVLTVGGQTSSYGLLPNVPTISYVSRSSSTSPPGGEASFEVQENSSALVPTSVAADDAVSVALGFSNPPLSPDINWTSLLTYTTATTPTEPNGVFTFDHKEIDASTGLAQNAQQAAGLPTATTVTIAAGGGTPPPPPSCAAIIEEQIVYGTAGPPSIDGKPTAIGAAFTPPAGIALTQAAKDCGVSGFDWQQKITVPSPSPFYANSNPTIPLSGTFYDPPFTGGTAAIPCPSGAPSTAKTTSYSWYFNPNPATSGDCMSVAYNMRRAVTNCGQSPESFGDNALCFGDAAADLCLPGAQALKTIVHAAVLCGGLARAPVGSALEFETQLVGYVTCGPTSSTCPNSYSVVQLCDPTDMICQDSTMFVWTANLRPVRSFFERTAVQL